MIFILSLKASNIDCKTFLLTSKIKAKFIPLKIM